MLRSAVWGICLPTLLAIATPFAQAERAQIQSQTSTKLVSPTNFAGCNASQISQLQQAFKDAALLASKAVNFDTNLYASMEFFGAPAYVHGGNHTIIQSTSSGGLA